jgi:hypothetical protein
MHWPRPQAAFLAAKPVNPTWQSHDFKVKMLDWSAARGSRLAYTCRRCGRRFCRLTAHDQGSWAVDADGRALESRVTDRWLSEECPRVFNASDENDRKRRREAVEQ